MTTVTTGCDEYTPDPLLIIIVVIVLCCVATRFELFDFGGDVVLALRMSKFSLLVLETLRFPILRFLRRLECGIFPNRGMCVRVDFLDIL